MKFAIIFAIYFVTNVYCLKNGLAVTPPMGFLSWERFRCNMDCKNDPNNCISERLFMEMADAMVAFGFADAGYEYVNLDDCWLAPERDSNGRLQPDPERFPHGIQWLANYMHLRGLKLGIYEDYGNYTCEGFPGILPHMQLDAQTFADWGIDYVKLDGCYADPTTMNEGYPLFGKFLNQTGRPMVYSCSWPDYLRVSDLPIPWDSIMDTCNLWRLYDDIQDSWDSVTSIIDYWGAQQSTLIPLNKPGSWNDPDELMIGDFGLSLDQSKVQFAMWAIWSAPLLISADIRNLPNWATSILLNKEIIAINQDPLGIQGSMVYNDSQTQIWAKPTQSGSIAVAVVNFSDYGQPAFISFNFTSVGVTAQSVNVRDLYARMDLGTFSGNFGGLVNPSGVLMLLLSDVQKVNKV